VLLAPLAIACGIGNELMGVTMAGWWHTNGYGFVAEAQDWFGYFGWIIDGRVWRTEDLGDGMVVRRLYPQRKEWMTL